MTGGTLQLTKYGAQNTYLNGNPQMTYFKSVYKRHTNFAMEAIRIDFEGTQNLAYNIDTQLRCKISRNGDLINKLYFCINLPDIYSAHDYDPEDGSGSAGANLKFEWVPNIGCQIIKKCTLGIGGSKISEIYGQWIEIFHEIFLDTSSKNNMDFMTGHIPDLFMPSHNGWNAGIYPSSSLKPDLSVNPDSNLFYFSEFKKNPYLQPPSIKGRQLYIPIPFWFCTNPGLALPLVALQYHEITLEFELRPITELYTIIETRNGGTVAKGARTAPDATVPWHHIGQFITGVPNTDFANGTDLSDGDTNIQGWNMDTHILCNYIFLDNDERTKFAKNNHEYLIEQIYRQEFTGATGNMTFDLNFQHPVKYFVWCAQRNDVSQFLNRHNNFTNWSDEFIPPGTSAYISLLGESIEDPFYYQTDQYGNIVTDNSGNKLTLDDLANYSASIPTKFNFNFYDENIIKTSKLLFDGVERFSTRDAIYFRHVQPYQHNMKLFEKSGIYLYSFSLDPSKYQPSGSCNMSRVSNLQLQLELNPIYPNAENLSHYDYNVFVYAINYNILRIVGGMAGVAFSN